RGPELLREGTPPLDEHRVLLGILELTLDPALDRNDVVRAPVSGEVAVRAHRLRDLLTIRPGREHVHDPRERLVPLPLLAGDEAFAEERILRRALAGAPLFWDGAEQVRREIGGGRDLLVRHSKQASERGGRRALTREFFLTLLFGEATGPRLGRGREVDVAAARERHDVLRDPAAADLAAGGHGLLE